MYGSSIAPNPSPFPEYRARGYETLAMPDLLAQLNDLLASSNTAPAVKHAAKQLVGELNLCQFVDGAHLEFAKLAGQKDLKIHLGCGPDIRPGFVNVDLWANRAPQRAATDPLFINHDLREGLPMEEGCASLVYSSHFFEHLDFETGLKMMRDCYRALRPGGRFRIVLPNLPAIFDAYLRRNTEWLSLLDQFLWVPEFKTLVDFVNYGAYQYGEHKYIYDTEKLQVVLKGLGYSTVEASVHEDGLDPDNEVRRRYSFYTNAIK